MNLIKQNSQSSIQYQLVYAQEKLMTTTLPLELRAISYIRICCSAMRKSCLLQQPGSTQRSISVNKPKPYLELLGCLSQEVPNWWNTCYVSDEGFLESHNANIQRLLQSINAFVEASIYPPLAA